MREIGSLRLVVIFVVFGLQVGGTCSNTSSDPESGNISTGRMTATFHARADGSGNTGIRAELFTQEPTGFGGRVPTQVELSGGDELRATRIDPTTLVRTEQVLVRDFGLFTTPYVSIFSNDEKDLRFEITFDRRGTGERSATDSFVTLPTPFELDWVDDPVAMTPAPTRFSRSSSISYFVIWDPFDAPDFEPGDELTYDVTGDCIRTYSGTIDWEAGEDVLELTGVLLDRDPPDDGMACPIEVEFTLERTGTLDAAFDAGSFRGLQVRVLNLQSTP
jgi:hypothetical protein